MLDIKTGMLLEAILFVWFDLFFKLNFFYENLYFSFNSNGCFYTENKKHLEKRLLITQLTTILFCFKIRTPYFVSVCQRVFGFFSNEKKEMRKIKKAQKQFKIKKHNTVITKLLHLPYRFPIHHYHISCQSQSNSNQRLLSSSRKWVFRLPTLLPLNHQQALPLLFRG